MRRRLRLVACLLLAPILWGCPHFQADRDVPIMGKSWVLIVPPSYFRDGGVRMEDRAPLWQWRRLAAFDDAPTCRRFRDARIGDAASDEAWAMWSMSRCETVERAAGPHLLPGE